MGAATSETARKPKAWVLNLENPTPGKFWYVRGNFTPVGNSRMTL